MASTASMEAQSKSDAIEEGFQRAADTVAAAASSLSKDQQLSLYGLYKQATCGECKEFRPSFFDVKARAKWAAWKTLDDMPPEEAKLQYVELARTIFPGSAEGTSSGKRQGGGELGPVVSTLKDEQAEEGGAKEMGSLQLRASQGDAAEVQRLLEAGSDVNGRDSEGCSALHWAADRGHVEVVQLLLKCGADVRSADADGQTPLHYAALCGQKEVVTLLLRSGADPSAQDAAGQTAEQIATEIFADCFDSGT